MNELALQKDVVDLVKNRDGFGLKMSNRFLVGVADLLIKLPNWPAMVIEVKLNKKPLRPGTVLLNLQVAQYNFLERTNTANMPCGVLSFMGASKRDLWVQFQPFSDLVRNDALKVVFHTENYQRLQKFNDLWPLLDDYARIAVSKHLN